MKKRILVTGANGFVGQALCAELFKCCDYVRAATRKSITVHSASQQIIVGEIDGQTEWADALEGIDVVVHLAARVHVMQDNAASPLNEFRKINVLGTDNLARQAVNAGVRRLIYVSSIKVNGESTIDGRPFTADELTIPADPYGISKYEAEQLLYKTAAETAMEVVVIRPPIIYGHGVKANFESMMGWLSLGIPLPLAALTDNKRSLVALSNLVDLIVRCLDHPGAANQTFLVSDGEDLSTAELLVRMGAALGHPARLFYVPKTLLNIGAMVLSQPHIYQRLCGSLQVDISKTRKILGWAPPLSVNEGLQLAARGFGS